MVPKIIKKQKKLGYLEGRAEGEGGQAREGVLPGFEHKPSRGWPHGSQRSLILQQILVGACHRALGDCNGVHQPAKGFKLAMNVL